MKVVILWLISENNEILLSQRSFNMSVNAGLWGPSISGEIEIDETSKQAAIREAHEELAIDPSNLTQIHYLHSEIHKISESSIREFDIYYAYIDKEISNSFKLEPNEVVAIKWVSLKELKAIFDDEPDNLIASYDKVLWENAFTNLKKTLNKEHLRS